MYAKIVVKKLNSTLIRAGVNMVSIERIPYSPAGKARAYRWLDHCRASVELPDDAIQGVRFKDNDSVFLRLESLIPEAEFMTCPRASIHEALIDAARSDHWYEFEKDYDEYATVEDSEED